MSVALFPVKQTQSVDDVSLTSQNMSGRSGTLEMAVISTGKVYYSKSVQLQYGFCTRYLDRM